MRHSCAAGFACHFLRYAVELMTLTRLGVGKGSNGLHMSKKTRLSGLVFLPFMLSGCCIFGFQSTTSSVWESDFPGNADQIQLSCESEIRGVAEKRTSRFVELAIAECAKEAPFSRIEFINPSTGEPYTRPDIAAGYAEALCPEVRASGKLSGELISQYCSECSTGRYELESCYKRNGLKRVERSGFECAPMRLY